MLTKIEKALAVIREAMETARNPVLLMTGGKDSLAVFSMCKPYQDRLPVLWSRTTGAFPHMVEFVRKATAGWKVHEVVSDQEKYFAQKGLPSVLVPLPITRNKAKWNRRGLLINSFDKCCMDLIDRPIRDFIRKHKIDAAITGQTTHDLGQGFLPMRQLTGSNCKNVSPLADWRPSEVMGYCLTHGVSLPLQYLTGLPDSLECWNCTAKVNIQRFNWMSRYCPELAVNVGVAIAEVYGAAMNTYDNNIRPILNATERLTMATRPEAPGK